MANSICALLNFFLWPYQFGMYFGRVIVSCAAPLGAAPCSLRLSPARANTMLAQNHLLQINKQKESKILFKNH